MARPRTPTALKIVKGTDQPCRTNKAEPKPEAGIPEYPAHLAHFTEEHRSVWAEIGAVLLRTGVLTISDGLPMEGLVCTVVELRSARRTLYRRGAGETSYECKTETGAVMYRAYPEVALVSDLDRRFIAWLAKFGMSPADRSKVSAIAKEDTSTGWQAFT